MKLHRIYAIILRFMYLFRHSLDRLSDAFYWPTLDLLLWGITSSYFRSYLPQTSQIVLVILGGILLWIIVWRGQYEITVGILEDLWNRNLVNIFVSPLKFSEWVVSLVTLGVIKAVMSFSFGLLVAFILYKIEVFAYGLYLIPLSLLLIMTGWWMGFFIAGLILRFGTKIQTLAWTAPWIIAPFSAIYYPVSSLPEWAQTIALLIPTSYVFEGAREVIERGILDPNKLYLSFLLNAIYIVLSLIFLKKSFNKVLKIGLVKVY
ncbi:MAG: ABC transporter permease [Patescibacteria group bacterium]